MLRQMIKEDCLEIVNDDIGIELTWTEKAALFNYLKKFELQEGLYCYEGLFRFLLDYFDLDLTDLGEHYAPEFGIQWGKEIIGTDEFKEYCRKNISHWRAERELI